MRVGGLGARLWRPGVVVVECRELAKEVRGTGLSSELFVKIIPLSLEEVSPVMFL